MYLCRLCGEEKHLLDVQYQLDDETDFHGKSYRQLIEHFTRVSLKNEEGLSVNICDGCRFKIIEFADFAGNLETLQKEIEEKPELSFTLDKFKKIYSNNEAGTAIDFLFRNFNCDKYSMWFCDYKFPEELKNTLTCFNLINGFFGFIEALQNRTFALMRVFGDDDCTDAEAAKFGRNHAENFISGVWVFTGNVLPFETDELFGYAYESYDWMKLDPKDEKTKKLFERYLKNSATDKRGRKLRDRKVFK